ncbi:MAG: YkgJ family cysteine cluster protein [Pseudomonadota bacterium]
MKEKEERLKGIYAAYDAVAAAFKTVAACFKGCAFCCTDAGSIDITTLEGVVIQNALSRRPRGRQTGLKKTLAVDMKRRLAGKTSVCPFLMKNRVCEIYPVRPFSCRRIYSLHMCTHDAPPVVSRQAMAAAAVTIGELQRLDDTGYSGHLSSILFMLDQPRFLATYQSGAFRPEEIVAFGKTHRIVINRMAAGAPPRSEPAS